MLGAASDEARSLLDGLDATVVVADDWADGMGASLKAGLTEIEGDVLITLVDLPDVGADVVARIPASGSTLARATYDGRPGHPVFIGAEHKDALATTLHGDVGARAYLDAHHVLGVECGDPATGRDVDSR
ncbi:nucleotidyltransferase family protein [Nocardioides sp. B-3]|uniref:nucleotidyltransferase family protein n=1 Tax=Nocardioides sp. B-3 TaxID=2895565 RepID=UPI002152E49E|nr:NTP transferase domain-containing protein [Nocardioides sp. B-3]UUZ57766.1 NTP transferase domain-containing protein [Nocardioides sp. B-3]